LRRARTVIPRVTELDPDLGQRLDVRFRQLASEVEDGLEGAADDGAAAALLETGEQLVAETLAFLGGAAARRYQLDDGLTTIALAWLDALSADAGLSQVGVVIPAPTEFTGMQTQVVRLKMPSDGTWALSVAVHEYGHFVASVLSSRETNGGIPESVVPVERLLHGRSADKDLPLLYWHGHELFADGVATLVTGPAHAEYCVRYRFDPAGANEPTPTHPAPARRLRFQLTVLERLAAHDASGLLAGDVERLRDDWSKLVAGAGQAADVPADALLDPLEPDLLKLLLESRQLKSIRYDEHPIAGKLAESRLERLQAGTSVAHVLNAAWLERRRIESEHRDDSDAREDEIGELETKTGAVVREVLGLA
jgi:hypothetical protein